eukprot:TRINITY_DN7899_c0_g1_i1.p1 TRINITY_DN7899_c0_g1~~TRINITY_DN7899_c0_g1_i1.p1  ORF type:complete len:155 (+),score=26.73 TRINITY_DN7899_c0_g1_i1:361-825(+)
MSEDADAGVRREKGKGLILAGFKSFSMVINGPREDEAALKSFCQSSVANVRALIKLATFRERKEFQALAFSSETAKFLKLLGPIAKILQQRQMREPVKEEFMQFSVFIRSFVKAAVSLLEVATGGVLGNVGPARESFRESFKALVSSLNTFMKS